MKAPPECKWIEGKVDPKEEHVKLGYGGFEKPYVPMAMVAPAKENVFFVEFLVNREQLEPDKQEIYDKVISELDFFLVELRERNPWAYAKHHCNTASNIYSDIRWSYYPKGWEGG